MTRTEPQFELLVTIPTWDTCCMIAVNFAESRRDIDQYAIAFRHKSDEERAAENLERAARGLPPLILEQRDVVVRYHDAGCSSATENLALEFELHPDELWGLKDLLQMLGINNGLYDRLDPEFADDLCDGPPSNKGGYLKNITTNFEKNHKRPSLDFAWIVRRMPDMDRSMVRDRPSKGNLRKETLEEWMHGCIKACLPTLDTYFALYREGTRMALDPEAFALALPKIASRFQDWMTPEFLNSREAPFTVPGYLVALWHVTAPEDRNEAVQEQFDFWMAMCEYADEVESRARREARRIHLEIAGDRTKVNKLPRLSNGRRIAVIEPTNDKVVKNLWGLMKEVDIIISRTEMPGTNLRQLAIMQRKPKEGVPALDFQPLYDALFQREGELLRLENAKIARQNIQRAKQDPPLPPLPLKKNDAWHLETRQASGHMVFNNSGKVVHHDETAIEMDEIVQIVVENVVVPPAAET